MLQDGPLLPRQYLLSLPFPSLLFPLPICLPLHLPPLEDSVTLPSRTDSTFLVALCIVLEDTLPATLSTEDSSGLNLNPSTWAGRHWQYLEQSVPLVAVTRVCPATSGFGNIALSPVYTTGHCQVPSFWTGMRIYDSPPLFTRVNPQESSRSANTPVVETIIARMKDFIVGG